MDPPLALSQILASPSLITVMYVCKYTYKCIIYTYVYMISGLTIWYWINNLGQEPMCWKFWDNPDQQVKKGSFMPGVRILVQ